MALLGKNRPPSMVPAAASASVLSSGQSHAPQMLSASRASSNGILQLAVNGGGAISHRPRLVQQASSNATLTGAGIAQPGSHLANGETNHLN